MRVAVCVLEIVSSLLDEATAECVSVYFHYYMLYAVRSGVQVGYVVRINVHTHTQAQPVCAHAHTLVYPSSSPCVHWIVLRFSFLYGFLLSTATAAYKPTISTSMYRLVCARRRR